MANRDSAYILGSGASLLNLSDEEKQFLNNHPMTLSINQYLLYWRLIGVVPKAHLLADLMFPNIKFFVDIQKEISALEQDVKFYMNQYYLRYFPNWLSFKQIRHAIRKRLATLFRNRYLVPFLVQQRNLVPIHQTKESAYSHYLDNEGWFWAENLDEPLYFYRGTLTTGINLASVLWPDADIKLLGVDLNSCGYFFDPDWGNYNREEVTALDAQCISGAHLQHHITAREVGIHSTAMDMKLEDGSVIPGVVSVMPRIDEELQKRGGGLYCCNPQSLLVTSGAIRYRPVID